MVDELAGAIVRAMRKKNYAVDTGPGEVTVAYGEGIDLDGKLNDDAPDRFNDARFAIRFDGHPVTDGVGSPRIVGKWEATTEPGRFWTENRMNEKGAARIAFGQYKAWQVGSHRGNHEALIQTGGAVTVLRDDNEDFVRTGDKPDTGHFGINQHHGSNLPKSSLGRSSAGCLVGRMIPGHEEFMRIVKADPRYVANRRFVFTAAVLDGKDIAAELALGQNAAPGPGASPPVTSPANPATTEPAEPRPPPAASPGSDKAFGRLSPTLAQVALDAATRSTIMRDHTWQRVGKGPIGHAPSGYLKGMTLAYLRLRAALADGDAVAQTIAGPVKPDDDRRDVLSWFRSKFVGFGGLADKGGPDTLRHVFVVLFPLGMNESAGKFCEGRDITAAIPPSSNTVEAGLFQTSWDAHNICPELEPLFRSYKAAGDDPEGLAPIFHEGVRCSNSMLENVGSGDGKEFQRMTKASPMFAILTAAIGVRSIGGINGHWGPIRRREVEIWAGTDAYLRALDALVDDAPVA